jgi:alkyl sulfatase BDS1-like metallo-beta-lactamase superfamily hydrolase
VNDLPFEDRADFEDADCGLIGLLDTPDPRFAIVAP